MTNTSPSKSPETGFLWVLSAVSFVVWLFTRVIGKWSSTAPQLNTQAKRLQHDIESLQIQQEQAKLDLRKVRIKQRELKSDLQDAEQEVISELHINQK